MEESCGSVLDEEERLITGEKGVLGRWEEYFQDLFTSLNSVQETVRTVGTNNEDEDKISIDEILRKVRKLKKGKLLGLIY